MALCENSYLDLSLYLHIVIPSILTCILSNNVIQPPKSSSGNPLTDYNLRCFSSHLLSHIISEYSVNIPSLLPHCVQSLKDVISDINYSTFLRVNRQQNKIIKEENFISTSSSSSFTRSIFSYYGCICSIIALGPLAFVDIFFDVSDISSSLKSYSNNINNNNNSLVFPSSFSLISSFLHFIFYFLNSEFENEKNCSNYVIDLVIMVLFIIFFIILL
jgi:hypothetical protein